MRASGLLSTGLLLLVLAGCSGRELPPLEPQPPLAVDFTGNWELHYGLSDQLQERIQLLHLLARRELERRSSQAPRSGSLVISGGGLVNSSSAIIGLGQMADMISRASILEIDQDDARITIEREDDFPLTCRFDQAGLFATDSLGAETCGWDEHQLVFRIALPDGLFVRHRLTLSPDGQHLNVATTVRTRRAPQPFTLNRVYERFEPLPSPYDCHETLDRGRVCYRIGRSSESG